MTLDIRFRQTTPGIVTVSPVGSIDSDTAPLLDKEVERLLTEPIKTMVLDMEGVSFISSAGIGIVAKAKTLLKKQGAELAMINLQPQVKKVFEIIRLLPSLNVFESVDELDAYLTRIQRKMEDE
jgi:anti-sigma B factor antagonist